MHDDPEVPLSPLIEIGKNEIAEHSAFAMLADVAAEQIWLANFASANTRSNYQRAVGSFVATLGISTPEELYSVKQAHVLAWRTSMERADLSPATIAARLAALSSLYNHLTDEQLTPNNPVAGVKRPNSGKGGTGSYKSPTLSERQVRAMLDAPDTKTLKGLRDRALLHVFFFCGARCTEPTKLKVKHFTHDNEYRVLQFTIKGNKSNPVAIHPECATAIREYLDAAGHGDDPDAYIFQAMIHGRPGQPMHRSSLHRLFDCYAIQAGIEGKAFPHMARATFITTAFEAGSEPVAIQRTVGHTSITTTEGYNHTAQKHRDSASLKVGY